MTEEIYRETMKNLCRYYKIEFNDFIDMIYWGSLQDLEDEEFKNGIIKMFKNRVFPTMPQPGDIRQYVRGKEEENKIVVATDNIKNAIKSFGSYYSVVFDDAIIHIVIEKHFGSWIKLCEKTIEEIDKFFKFDFEKIYKAYSAQKHLEIQTVLKGRHDNQNENRDGYIRGEYTKYIGNKEKAIKWIRYYEKKVLENQSNNQIKALSNGKTY